MKLLVLLFTAVMLLFAGKSANRTQVYLERGEQLIAFQATGDRGKVHFKHLDAGSYRLSLIFPQQEGKYIKEKPKHQTLTKASYNPKNKSYYYQGPEGYFEVTFTERSKIKNENFKAVFREERDEEDTYNIIAEFGMHKDGGSIAVHVKALTAARFKKATDKIGQDISMQSIQGIK